MDTEQHVIPDNEYGTADMQRALYELLVDFQSLCKEHGINYFLFAGSCLGAVRHQGFIPWDDDLDIIVDRKNYNRLMRCLRQEERFQVEKILWVDRIQLQDAGQINGYYPTIDVFIIDNLPDSSLSYRWKILRLSLLQGMLKEDVTYKGFSVPNKVFLFVSHVLGKLFSTETLQRLYDKVSQVGNRSDTAEVMVANATFRDMRRHFPANTWQEYKQAVFEGGEYPIPEQYDQYLKIHYGDYMTLPPEEDRAAEHMLG